MAVRANGSDTGGIAVVNTLLVFLIHGISHFVAGYAECERIGLLHRGIDPAPEYDA
jgi:hypothetical protein